MTYKMIKTEENFFDVKEMDTNTIIKLDKSESEVKTICRKLNLGSGFNGWTPSFFAEQKGLPF